MRPRLRIFSFAFVVCVCTLLGVITNYAVAWWGYVRYVAVDVLPLQDLPLQWPRPVPSHWPQSPTFAVVESHGWAASEQFMDMVTTPAFSIGTAFFIDSCGWPYKCLERTRQDRNFIGRQTCSPSELVEQGLLDVPLAWQKTIGAKVLPGKIRPKEFALNTAFYTAIFATLWFTPLALTRLIRRRKGHCPNCNYDRTGLAASTPCPECGTSPAPR